MPPVKSWCYSFSFFSFALRKEAVHVVVLMFLLFCGVYFLLAEINTLLSEIYGDSAANQALKREGSGLLNFLG